MSSSTYNPIGKVHNQPPALEAGTKLVVMRDGKWVEASSTSDDSLKIKSLKLLTQRMLIILAVSLSVFVYLFGIGGLLLAVAVSIGFIIFLNVQRDNPISMFFLGSPTQYHLVDVSTHKLRTEHDLQLGETVKKVTVILQFYASVKDSAGVVSEGITDTRDALEQKIFRAIQNISKNATLTDRLNSFKETLREFSDNGFSDPFFKISEMTFELSIDPKTTQWLEEEADEDFEREGRERKLREAKHKAIMEAEIVRAQTGVYRAQEESRDLERQEINRIFDSAETLRIELLRPGANREAIHEELNRRFASESQNLEQKIGLLRFLVKEGALEGHEIQSKYPGFSEALIEDVANSLEGSSSKDQLAAPPSTAEKPLIEQSAEPTSDNSIDESS